MNNMRMKALQMSMKEKPSGMEEMMKMKKKRMMESSLDDFADMPMDEESMEGEEMEQGEGMISMPVSEKEKQIILMYRKKMKQGMPSEEEAAY